MIDLKIHQQFGRIGLEIKDAKYDLGIKKPNLDLTQTPARIDMRRTDPSIEIDYSPMLESLGYGDIEYMNYKFVQEAQADYLTGLEKNVALGNTLAAIQNKLSLGEIIARFNEPREKDLMIQPLAPIRIISQPGTLHYQAELGGLSTKLEYGEVSIDNFTYPSVKAYLEQKPELRIEAVGQIVDQKK
jgi:hypothetical protein